MTRFCLRYPLDAAPLKLRRPMQSRNRCPSLNGRFHLLSVAGMGVPLPQQDCHASSVTPLSPPPPFLPPQGKAPQPSSDLVFIQPSGPASYWVLSYSGWASEKTMLNRALVVIKALDDAGKKYDASYFFSAGYDSPFRLTGRHNEVWIPAL